MAESKPAMTAIKALEILTYYNLWRGDNFGKLEMQNPKDITEALEFAIDVIAKLAVTKPPAKKQIMTPSMAARLLRVDEE